MQMLDNSTNYQHNWKGSRTKSSIMMFCQTTKGKDHQCIEIDYNTLLLPQKDHLENISTHNNLHMVHVSRNSKTGKQLKMINDYGTVSDCLQHNYSYKWSHCWLFVSMYIPTKCFNVWICTFNNGKVI